MPDSKMINTTGYKYQEMEAIILIYRPLFYFWPQTQTSSV